MENTKVFIFEGSPITFGNENGLMINATEMARAFKKNPSEWLRLSATESFLSAMEAMGKAHRSESIITVNGVGSFFDEDVAIEFARWLSPKFAIWVNDMIKKLMKEGSVSLAQSDDEIVAQGMAILTRRIEGMQKVIAEQKPKADYYDKIINNTALMPTKTIAEHLGMSAIALNKILAKNGIQYKQGATWYLYQKYISMKYADLKPYHYKGDQGEDKVTHFPLLD